jgi:hypothetical protein
MWDKQFTFKGMFTGCMTATACQFPTVSSPSVL